MYKKIIYMNSFSLKFHSIIANFQRSFGKQMQFRLHFPNDLSYGMLISWNHPLLDSWNRQHHKLTILI